MSGKPLCGELLNCHIVVSTEIITMGWIELAPIGTDAIIKLFYPMWNQVFKKQAFPLQAEFLSLWEFRFRVVNY